MQTRKCSLLFFFCIPLFLSASLPGEKVEKRITREFQIQADGRVEIENKYGNIDIGIGPSGKVTMEVVMTVTAGSKKKAEENLQRISIDFEEGNNRVSAQTEIESATTWNLWSGLGKVDMDIRYNVSVPADVYLDLTNKYGNIYVETTDRELNADLGYGNIRLGDINARLKLDMAYSNGSISQIRDGDFNLAYSELEMEDAQELVLDMKYTDLKTGTVQKMRLLSSYSNLHAISIHDLDYRGKYDDLILEQGGKVFAESAYTGIVVDEMMSASSFEMRYGDLKVSNIHPGFEKISVNTSYTGVKLHFKTATSFKVDAETNYCGIKYANLKVSENIDRTTSRILKGTRGSGGGLVYARMNYGELSIE